MSNYQCGLGSFHPSRSSDSPSPHLPISPLFPYSLCFPIPCSLFNKACITPQ
ncbi:MAG: hypothetical protein F6J90_07810 [Moorea sp. SIOASIH]|uniref:hypothetical protein n=1 Tax=Moorena sp. SIOASIH TaxID=2607817 RepID=UPI0013BCA253|nr:hypothetical protein [Moorena sp. SIOASIH]NEO36231.1 hypothetical protein [Moorena sp. SIOASIH]